jgi:Domain of unknown function (DUF4296)
MRIVVLLILLFLSCGQNKAVPDGVLPVRSMTEILWDLMVVDELVAYRYPADLMKRLDSATAVYTQVVAAHGTTRNQLQKSVRYYEGRPDLLQVIFDSLNKRAATPIPVKKDSISAM